jgi:hypothetical protein
LAAKSASPDFTSAPSFGETFGAADAVCAVADASSFAVPPSACRAGISCAGM